MKIAGLTWWRNNYGSVLQAYALQSVMNEFDNIDYEILNQYSGKVASVDNFYHKIKTFGIRKTVHRIVWKFGTKKLRNRNLALQKFIDEKLKTSEKQYKENSIDTANEIYDGFLCGSDQIWNPELTTFDSIYWLRFVNSGKLKIAYAPSIGIDQVTEEQKKSIRKNLNTFHAISCREESGRNLLSSIMGTEDCETVLDPTLLADRAVWDNICPPRRFTEKYIFVYLLRGTKQQRKFIELYADFINIKIVTMPFLDNEHINKYDRKFGDIKYWDASPSDFISVIRYAEAVFTDSFHCMIFSCLYHRNFYLFPKIGAHQMNRLTDLQNMLHISARLLGENATMRDLLRMEAIDWDMVDSIIKEKRMKSKSYLKKALGVA
nr:polysaccharide pyruvyl transferase family protein [uncultured Clostridium sp.]